MRPFPEEDGFEVVDGDGVVEATWLCVSYACLREEKERTYILNSGVSLYFANSASQSAWVRGGMTPVIGFHSVILKPDSVRRVTPPTTIIASTSVADAISHPPTAGEGRTGRGAVSRDASAWALVVAVAASEVFAEECSRDESKNRRTLGLAMGRAWDMLGVKNLGEETIRERLAKENIERVVLACTGAIRGSAVHLSEVLLKALSSISVAASKSSWAL